MCLSIDQFKLVKVKLVKKIFKLAAYETHYISAQFVHLFPKVVLMQNVTILYDKGLSQLTKSERILWLFKLKVDL